MQDSSAISLMVCNLTNGRILFQFNQKRLFQLLQVHPRFGPIFPHGKELTPFGGVLGSPLSKLGNAAISPCYSCSILTMIYYVVKDLIPISIFIYLLDHVFCYNIHGVMLSRTVWKHDISHLFMCFKVGFILKLLHMTIRTL